MINYFGAVDCGIHHSYTKGIGKTLRKKKKAKRRQQSAGRKNSRNSKR